jgi:GxxExxY protein
MAELLHRELTRKLIGVYYDVYNGLSHNYPEYIYESAVAQDLGRRRIACSCQVEYEVVYKDWRGRAAA